MSKVILVASGKGGVGKTTTAINIGAALNSLKEDVLVVDGNLTTPNIGLYFGAPIVPVNLNHVLSDKAELYNAIYEHESGTKILPASLSVNDLRKIKYSKMKDLSKKLKEAADYIIVDSAAGLGEESTSAMDMADEIIVVINPELPSVTDALKTIKVAESKGKPVKGAVITRYTGAKTDMTIQSIRSMLEVPIIGVVPEDKKAKQAVAQKDAVFHLYPRAKMSKAYKDIALNILGLKDFNKKDNSSFFGKLFGKLGF